MQRKIQTISLLIQEGILGVVSKETLDTKQLCRRIAHQGISLDETKEYVPVEMKQKKIKLNEQIIYIDTHTMLYEDMKVLEYLMFSKVYERNLDAVKEQKIIFEFLYQIGLGYISLSQIKYLTKEEKMLVVMIAACFSKCNNIILELTDYQFSDSQIESIRMILQSVRKFKKAIVLGTLQTKLIGVCCDTTTLIHGGKQLYFGSVEKLYKEADRVLYIIKHSNLEELYHQLKETIKEYEYRIFNQKLLVLTRVSNLLNVDRNEDTMNTSSVRFLECLVEHNMIPDQIKKNKGRVDYSFQELIEFHDI